jgi:hypothetical protein
MSGVVSILSISTYVAVEPHTYLSTYVLLNGKFGKMHLQGRGARESSTPLYLCRVQSRADGIKMLGIDQHCFLEGLRISLLAGCV